MNNQGVVSVIVPVYNVERYLDRCINSLLEQTYPFIEIILIDDGSHDKCGEICDAFALLDRRIKVIHKTNAGLGMARNTGLDYASGDYVVFVDSDDYVAPEYVEVLLGAIVRYNAEIAIAGFMRNSLDGTMTAHPSVTLPRICKDREVVEQVLFPVLGSEPSYKFDVESEMSVWRNIYRRDVIESLRLRFVSEREYVSEDLLFNVIYLLNIHTAVQIPECPYHYSENSSSLTHSYREDRFEKYCALFLKEVDILKEYQLYEKSKLRLFRTYIMKAKKCIAMISAHKCSLSQKKKLCLDVLNNEIFCSVIREYKGYIKTKAQCIQLYMLEKKMAIAWIALYQIRGKIQTYINFFRKRPREINKKVVIS